MIEFYSLTINRLIIHTILAKEDGQDSATVDTSNEISIINKQGLEIIQKRLTDAAGKNSKAFQLEVENKGPDSFFEYSHNLSSASDPEFIERTKNIAYLLADNQTRKKIPGGYLLILDCLDGISSLPTTIVIKAEPHEGLQFSSADNSQVNVLEKVFLTPSQKFYKVGIIQTTEEADQYDAYLFDDQFRADSHPAEYFYKNFLGFSVGNNGKIQSQRFYDKTKKFIVGKIEDPEVKIDLLSALKHQFTLNQEDTIQPINFGETYFARDPNIMDQYISSVCQELPGSFVKDPNLIKSRLTKRNMNFTGDIKIVGPEEVFDNNVEVINEARALQELDFDSPNYTIIKISGKPYSFNE